MFPKTKLQLNNFLLFILIWSISIILAIFSKFPNLVAFLFKQFCNYFFYLILNFEVYFNIIIFIFSIIYILMLKIRIAGEADLGSISL